MSGEIMTVQQLAAYLHVGTGKLYRLAQSGQLPGVKVGGTWRFRRDLIDACFTTDSPGLNNPQAASEITNQEPIYLAPSTSSQAHDSLPPVGIE